MAGTMTAVPAAIKAAYSPQVNLIPPEVASRRARSRARALIVLSLMLVVMALAGWVYLTQLRLEAEEARLAEESRVTNDLQVQIEALNEVPRVEAELNNVREARLYAGGTEVHWSELFDDIRLVTPETTSLTSLSWDLPGMFGAVAPNDFVFGTPDIGSVSFAGESLEYIDAAELTRALDTVPWLKETRIVTNVVQEGDRGTYYVFSGTSRVTIDALTNRFSDEWLAEWELIQQQRAMEEGEGSQETPDPEPSPSASATDADEEASA